MIGILSKDYKPLMLNYVYLKGMIEDLKKTIQDFESNISNFNTK